MNGHSSPASVPSALDSALERRKRWMEERELARSGHATSDPRLADLLFRLKAEAGVEFSPQAQTSSQPLSRESRAIEALRQELTCPLCLDTLSEPLVLDCGHAFCRSCLHTLGAVSPQASGRCPLCRAVVRRPTPSLALSNAAEQARCIGACVSEPPGGFTRTSKESSLKSLTDVVVEGPAGALAAPTGLVLLGKRIQIVEAAISSCESQLTGFDELVDRYYRSTAKIEERISALRRQKDALDLDYQTARSSMGAVLKRLDLLEELLVSLKGEKLALEHAAPGRSVG